MKALPAPLAALAAYRQFVVWYAEPKPGEPGKTNKFPVDWQTGKKHDAHDAAIWTDFDQAAAAAPQWDRGHGSGVGFVFTDADPFFFGDLDHCLQADRTWSPLAQSVLSRFPGAAVEVSMSGTGLHVIGQYVGPAPEHSVKNTALGLELYTSKRFVALTGTNAIGDVTADCTAGLHAFVAAYFVPTLAPQDLGGWTTEPVAEWSGPEDDDALIALARASAMKNAAAVFGGAQAKATFDDLWTGDPDVLAATFPQAGRDFGHTEADQALANHLAFWTGKNCERIERLMRASGLYREKWDEHATYLTGTIIKACAYVQAVLTGKKPAGPLVTPPTPEALAQAAGVRVRAQGREYMGPLEQIDHFEHCYFLADKALIYDLAANAVWAKSSFDVVFGGHLFITDAAASKKTSSAWDAYTQSLVLAPRIVNDLCFRPEILPGTVVTQGNRTRVNAYVPYDCPTLAGDAKPFLGLMEKLFPIEFDRDLVLHYMASLVQNPGVKFQWWPVIQGTFGNGKTFLQEAIRFVVGDHYSHLPNAAAMARDGLKFNSWIDRKLFIGVEEISLKDKRDFLEEFKMIVTNRMIPLEGKGTNQITADNRANGMLFTNHLDGVPVTVDERRYAVFYTPQQCAADLVRDGMGGSYFPDLYDWFFGREAYAKEGADFGARVIANYLKTYRLAAQMDPARDLQRAPKTSSTYAAIANSRGRAEQEILEAIEEERIGFAGGWVSSTYLDVLLDTIRAPVPRSKRRELMRSLGYDWHPLLVDGRVNDVVMPDNKKAKLYVAAGHAALNLATAAEVQRAYSTDQQPGPVASAAVVAFAPRVAS